MCWHFASAAWIDYPAYVEKDRALCERLTRDAQNKLITAQTYMTCHVEPSRPTIPVSYEPAYRARLQMQDLKLLECAQEANATYLVTGDKDLLMLGKFGRSLIMTPFHFIRKVRSHCIVIKPITPIECLAGVDAGNMRLERMRKKLDKIRSHDRY